MVTAAGLLLLAVIPVGQLDPLSHLGTLTEDLDSPARLAITSSGLLVTDPRRNAIVQFDFGGAHVGTWVEPGGPLGVAVHPDGRIFVSRRDDAKVAIYDEAFVFQRFLGEGIVEFIHPTDLAVDSTTGRLYVVDSGADCFHAFASDESLALTVGTRGSGLGQFMYPSAIDSGNQIGGVTSPYTHTGRTNGITYYYIVTAMKDVAGDEHVEISWDPVAGATSYNIYWETNPEVTRATANQIVDVASPYVHAGLTNGTAYYYIVTAVHPTGETFGPHPVSATPTDQPGRPVTPRHDSGACHLPNRPR